MKVLLVNYTGAMRSVVEKIEKELSLAIHYSVDPSLAIDEVHKSGSEVIIINWSNDAVDAVRLSKGIRRLKLTPYRFILVIINRDREGELTALADAGADDFIIKPFSTEELAARLHMAARMIKTHETMRKSKKNMLKYSREDTITNVLNRRALLDEVLKEMGRASREKKFVSALMAGIANFEEIIDAFGEETAGDVLAEFSRRLKASCRPYDKIGRYGVSEFMVFIPGAEQSGAERIARRIIPAISGKPFVIKGNTVTVRAAIGISELDPEDVARSNHVDDHLVNDLILDALIRRSEMAMNKALKDGEESVQTYSFT